MSAKAKRKVVTKTVLLYIFFICVAIVMIYPLVWLFFASFKDPHEIFGSAKLLPKTWDVSGYVEGWNGLSYFPGYSLFMKNGFIQAVPTVILTVISSVLIGYGFARFNFIGKKFAFAFLLATMMLPNAILIVPRYIIFRNLGVLNTFIPFYLQAALGTSAFFNYMMVQFFRGIPKELDESAKIDGCNSFKTLVYILLPNAKASIISVVIFQFLWTWNDFFNTLIYVTTTTKVNATLGLRLLLDNTDGTKWNKPMAMSMVSILPPLILYAFFQKYFVEGVATTGLKG